MGCFSGCLMSSAIIQKLFCGICSAFKCSFDEFVEEKVVSLSYSSTILGPSHLVFINLSLRACREFGSFKHKLPQFPCLVSCNKTILFFSILGLPWWLKWQSICLQCRRPRFDPWVGKILWRRNGNPLQYSCLDNPMDRGAL